MLDTTTCIRHLNGRSRSLRKRLLATDPAELCVCSIVKAEMFFGAAKSTDPAGNLARQQLYFAKLRSYPFDDVAAIRYGNVKADLAQCGLLIGPNDLLIASICLANALTLVTHNVGEFSRVSGLQIEDWEAGP